MDAQTRRQVRDLSAHLRRTNLSTAQIAGALIDKHGLNPRVAFRYALGLGQAEVADRYNRRWPGPTPKTHKQISYWERWQGPGTAGSSSARTPCLQDLGRLAALYGCLVDDLLFGPRRGFTPLSVSVSYEVVTDVLAALQGSAEADYPGHGQDDGVVALRAAIGEGNITVTLSRRRFSALLATGGLAALLPDALPTPAAADTGNVADSFRRVLTAH